MLTLSFNHLPSQADLPEEVKQLGKVPVFFEHIYTTQHHQIQIVPEFKEDASSVNKVFFKINLNEVQTMKIIW